ncbi:hypothetical protein SAMN04489761_3760 [Tenacibaculum sp. MAR_2009_124]|uniref:hypothetical protein n=1 Tax=Tenacibaculum sp. MAR_2009_124 TaxID=1250059 RepID=UPI000898304D|nr:hypothetical protein [Tenacibaculum sp. MAR_2009_124]SEC84786.1 hypothetical protein SAMN04489761_3760 [Tenacibaculum sp. MAR_2009_124]
MKRKINEILVLIIGSLFLISCGPTKHYVSHILNKEDINRLKSKKTIIKASDNVDLDEFVTTFNKMFTSKADFSEKFKKTFRSKLKNSVLFSNVEVGEINTFDLLREKSRSDYLIYLSNFEVTNRIEMRNSPATVGPNNFGTMHTTSVEYCVINVKVNIYDLKTKRKVHEFTAIGESSVFLFNFKNTLNKAKERAITHIINYLNSGKTLYKQY